MRRLIVLLVVVVVMFGAVGCTKKSAYKPSRLMGDLYSGESQQAVQRKLNVDALQWELVEDRRSLADAQGLPWHSLVIVTRNYESYGQKGDLLLSFFNDELVSAQFYVRDVEAAKDAISAKQGLTFSAVNDAHIDPDTRVWVGRDQTGRSYVGWIDRTRQAARDQAVQ